MDSVLSSILSYNVSFILTANVCCNIEEPDLPQWSAILWPVQESVMDLNPPAVLDTTLA